MRVEDVQIQISFEFKLVCNLQNGLKIKRGFSNFLEHFGPNPSLDPVGLLPRAAHMALPASTWPCQPTGFLLDLIHSTNPNRHRTRYQPVTELISKSNWFLWNLHDLKPTRRLKC
jgi:hypothetical protein